MNMLPLDSTELQRLRYWQGQLLRSRDFNDQTAIDERLRAWHNRALHNVFGVSTGLSVAPLSSQGGALTALRVAPGVAYDCFGRSLILHALREIPVPVADPHEKSLTLLIRCRQLHRFPEGRTTRSGESGFCAAFQGMDFLWKCTSRVEARDGVPLARAKYDSGVPRLDATFVAPPARALAKAHVASGATLPGGTAWELWSEAGFGEMNPIGFQVRVDTASPGFTEVPCFFAGLQGVCNDVLQGNPRAHALAGLFVHVDNLAEISSRGFTFRLLFFPGERSATDNQELLAVAKGRLFVCWLGIQPGVALARDFYPAR